MVYNIAGGHYPGNPDPEPYFENLDGDFMNLELVDRTPDGGRVLIPKKSGRKITSHNVPTKVKRGGPGLKRLPLLDVNNVYSCLMVNQTFKDILEELEPDVHQYFPMAVMVKGEKIADHFWLNICNRLDTVHKTSCIPPLNEYGRWRPKTQSPENKLVFDEKAIGGHHAWHDKFQGGTFISEMFAERLQEAGVTGVGYGKFEQA